MDRKAKQNLRRYFKNDTKTKDEWLGLLHTSERVSKKLLEIGLPNESRYWQTLSKICKFKLGEIKNA